jgi:predicted dehydrogenase
MRRERGAFFAALTTRGRSGDILAAMLGPKSPTRRQLLAGGSAALTALSYRRVLGANDRIRLGIIGTGQRAQSLMKRLKELPGNQQVVVCDVYEPRIAEAVAIVGEPVDKIGDYRVVLARKDIDGVVIGSPQHWHKKMTLDALAADKDVFLEKCVSHDIDEGVELCKAVAAASKRVVQTGTQQRSQAHYIQGHQLVRSGGIGQITFVHAFWYQNVAARNYPDWKPDKLDWKRFTGTAPMHPVTWDRYFKWRWFWDYGGGPICELLTHWIDVVHWYTGSTTPTAVTARGARHASKYETPDTSTAVLEYPGFTVAFTNTMTSKVGDGGVEFHGSKGTLRVDRQHLAVYPEQAPFNAGSYLPTPSLLVKSDKDGTLAHVENFLSCMRSRATPTAPMPVAHEAARASHLTNLSLRWNRPVRWNGMQNRPERA